MSERHEITAPGGRDRVVAAATFAPPAPYDGTPEWFAGMASPGALRAATAGRGARLRFAEAEQFDPAVFTPADRAALEGPWTAVGADAEAAQADGAEGWPTSRTFVPCAHRCRRRR